MGDMTPKEKAKELVEKFLNEQNNSEEVSEAKQCALICIDEIISALENHKWQNQYVIDLYKELKQEINKL